MDAVRRQHSTIAALLLLPLVLHPVNAAAQVRPHQADAAPVAEGQAQPAELTEQDVLFAHHRMAGGELDFDSLAEATLPPSRPSPYPARNKAAERRYRLAQAARRLRAEFESFDLNRPLTLTIGAEILGYDRKRGGIPLDLGALRFFVKDPTGQSGGFMLRFRNADAIAVIPAANADAAAELLQGAGLASFGDHAGYGTVMLTFVFARALPQAPEVAEAPLSTEILSARVKSAAGVMLHHFDRVGSVAAAVAAREAGPPVLRKADIFGLRIGMTRDEARAAVSRDHLEQLGPAFYDRPPKTSRRRGRGAPECSSGLITEIRAFGVPLAPENSYAACIAPALAGPGDAMAGHLAEVTGIRFLPGAEPERVRRQLEERFGPPLEEVEERLIWIGRDPAGGAWDGLVELRAEFVQVAQGGPEREPGVLLALSLRRHLPMQDGS